MAIQPWGEVKAARLITVRNCNLNVRIPKAAFTEEHPALGDVIFQCLAFDARIEGVMMMNVENG